MGLVECHGEADDGVVVGEGVKDVLKRGRFTFVIFVAAVLAYVFGLG